MYRKGNREEVMAESHPKSVQDIMTTTVITITEDETLEKIESAMQRFRFRHLPVVDGKRLVGLVTHRDILRTASSWLERDSETRTHQLNMQAKVHDIMTKIVISVRPETSLLEAGLLILENKMGCLPVLDANDELVGIVTQSDFVHLAMRFLEEDVGKM
jgi:CBS domain-containing membrane protein